MISVAEASEIVMDNARNYGTEHVPLQNAIGGILAEDVLADRDFPPFDRVMMDGIAIAYDSYMTGQRQYEIEDIATAGQPQKSLSKLDYAIEVMTGAPLPHGADTVIRYEDLSISDGIAEITTETISHQQSVHHRGRDHLEGQILLPTGHLIKAIDINVLATVGMDIVRVKRMPTVAIISTGDELVNIDNIPQPHQIRRSNAPMLAARLSELGIVASDYHMTDAESDIRDQLKELIQTHDVLLMSGGVSMGRYDLLPKILSELGVEQLFHKVRQRPGKPFWFGRTEGTIVFAFPGNPVSTLACFHKYFISWLDKCLGKTARPIYVTLAKDYSFVPDLHHLAQVTVEMTDMGGAVATISRGNGSGDIVHPTQMDGWVELPRGQELYKAGETYRFIPFYPFLR